MIFPVSMAILFLCVAIFVSWLPSTRQYAFAFWVLAFVGAAFYLPELFTKWGRKDCGDLIVPLLQVAMFGMGATLTIHDFSRVLKMPKAVAIGMVLQFTVMPFGGWFLATVFQLPTEIAVGVILIGSCPGGIASNVVTFLAKGNVALSVTMTACSTLMAPVMTPLMMRLLAGRMVEVDVFGMMYQIFLVVIVPIAVGLLVNPSLPLLGLDSVKVERWLSVIAMIAICLICAIIVAAAHQSFKSVGVALLCVVALHNFNGYVLGYWGSRLCRLDEACCRTVAIEVGMQNGGLGASLAKTIFKSTEIALASAIFGPWMSATGSILAAWWRKRPIEEPKR